MLFCHGTCVQRKLYHILEMYTVIELPIKTSINKNAVNKYNYTYHYLYHSSNGQYHHDILKIVK